jgi:hypothetical protein
MSRFVHASPRFTVLLREADDKIPPTTKNAIQFPLMRRKLFTLVAAISLVLCVLMSILWVRSVFAGAVVEFNVGQRQILVESVGGLLSARCVRIYEGLARERDKPRRLFESQPRSAFNTNYTNGNPWTHLGFWRLREQGDWRGTTATYTWISIPFWFLALVTAPAGVWLCQQKYREFFRPTRAGCCRKCGYDLRATPDRCPECGRVAATIE